MLVQHDLIARVRALCEADERLSAALMYGSFARGGGDRFSDIEFWLFSETEIEPEAWIAQVGETYAVVEHVALFKPSLVRGEFHFAPAVDVMRSWTELGVTEENLETMIVVDRDGRLREVLTELIGVTPRPRVPGGRFVNWFVMGLNLLERGDVVRAHEVLGILLGELPRDERYARCTAPAEREALVTAYQEAWACALKLSTALSDDLLKAVTQRTERL